MKVLSKIVLWSIAMLYMIMFVGCTEPLIQIDSSSNTMNVGTKYKDDRVINFRSRKIR